MLKKIFRFLYYLLYGESGKTIKINNEDYRVSAYVSRGIKSSINETPLKLLANLTKNAALVFDIGANIGTIAIILSKKMKPGTVIYSFEPVPLSFKYLADTARVQQGNATIRPVNFAISNKNERLYFTNNGSSCRNHISAASEPGTVAIEAITIDDFCRKNNVIPEVLKIDIEGAEYWALEGMQQTLKENNCHVLLEIHKGFLTDNNIDGAKIGSLIDKIGYKVFNEAGTEIPSREIMDHACVILSKERPAASVFKIH
jgi:FkbM family methyltransferase